MQQCTFSSNGGEILLYFTGWFQGTVQKEAGVGKVVVKEKEPGAKEKNASGSTGPSEGLVKPSQDALPSSLQSATTVTRHTGGGGTTPTKKVLPPDLQLPTLPALPGASDSATAAKSVTADAPSKSVQPEAPSQAARTSVSIAPEPDEVVIVSTSTVTSVGQPPRLQQRKGINLGFCRNQEVNFQNQRYAESSLSQTEICRGSTSPDIASTSSPSLAPSSSSASSCSGWTRSFLMLWMD